MISSLRPTPGPTPGAVPFALPAAKARRAADLYTSGPVAPRAGLLRCPPSPERDARVAACVNKVMARINALPRDERVRAKVGQMIQYASEAIAGPDGGWKDFEQKVRAGQVGSFLYAGDKAQADRFQRIAVEESPLGIPLLFAWDVIHGLRTI